MQSQQSRVKRSLWMTKTVNIAAILAANIHSSSPIWCVIPSVLFLCFLLIAGRRRFKLLTSSSNQLSSSSNARNPRRVWMSLPTPGKLHFIGIHTPLVDRVRRTPIPKPKLESVLGGDSGPRPPVDFFDCGRVLFGSRVAKREAEGTVHTKHQLNLDQQMQNETLILLDFCLLPPWGTDNLPSFFPSSPIWRVLPSVSGTAPSLPQCSSSSGSFSLQAHGALNFLPPQPTRVLQCPNPPEGLDE